ncbi:MAG TPA: hypothetical protein P5567_07390 [Kiritimatiellia bacterium]|nr:hypothetical protein [Kiritimatiellia bacterium]HRZ12264.1 hypothetical protein [Kiritimatiellia bacterium]HSA17978.1 hypothetical protein [Kiritimatiellia bacterium]
MKTNLWVTAGMAWAMTSCSGEKGPFREIRAWDSREMPYAMVFCAAATNQDEAAVRREADRIAANKLRQSERVVVVILYDADRARDVSSEKAMRNMMSGAGAGVNALLYGGRFEGGGFLSAAREGTTPAWTFVPFRDTGASARDKAFSR